MIIYDIKSQGKVCILWEHVENYLLLKSIWIIVHIFLMLKKTEQAMYFCRLLKAKAETA